MAVAQVKDLKIERGMVWDHLIIIKDRWSHRRRRPTECSAALRIEDGVNAGDYIIPSTVSWEGGVLLSMTAENTEWLEPGTYPYDVRAVISRSHFFRYTSSDPAETIVVRGTITVSEYENITPMDSDGNPVALDPVV